MKSSSERRSLVLVAFAAGAAVSTVVTGLLWYQATEDLAQARKDITYQEAQLRHFEEADDRGYAVKKGVSMASYQEWAEQQYRFVERRGRAVCIVEHTGNGKYRVQKYKIGDNRAVQVEFQTGGPDACDRVQL